MQKEPVIVFDEVERVPEHEDLIRRRMAKLEEIYDGIVGCRVAVKPLNKGRASGTLHDVHVWIQVPGHDVVVGGGDQQNHANEDLRTAIDEAFDVAERQLREHAERLRGDVKQHEVMERGQVVKIVKRGIPEEDDQSYGFIATFDGRELYFHRNALSNGDFDELEEGSLVAYREADGTDGPKASLVRVVQ